MKLHTQNVFHHLAHKEELYQAHEDNMFITQEATTIMQLYALVGLKQYSLEEDSLIRVPQS